MIIVFIISNNQFPMLKYESNNHNRIEPKTLTNLTLIVKPNEFCITKGAKRRHNNLTNCDII